MGWLSGRGILHGKGRARGTLIVVEPVGQLAVLEVVAVLHVVEHPHLLQPEPQRQPRWTSGLWWGPSGTIQICHTWRICASKSDSTGYTTDMGGTPYPETIILLCSFLDINLGTAKK